MLAKDALAISRRKPERIVCLTEEPTETLYLLGEGHRIVGISAYTCRPEEAKDNHPVVSAFIKGSVVKIKALEPDLVIGFSDIQAELARELIANNLQVLIFNQRSIQEIMDTIHMLGRLVGAEKKADALVTQYAERLRKVAEKSSQRAEKIRVYFEEWDDPMITAIRWISELIELCGGEDIFRDRSHGKLGGERIVSADEVIEAQPQIMFASWCGKALDRSAVLARPGWERIPAVANDRIYELDPSIILQPGPAALTDGLDALERHIQEIAS